MDRGHGARREVIDVDVVEAPVARLRARIGVRLHHAQRDDPVAKARVVDLLADLLAGRIR